MQLIIQHEIDGSVFFYEENNRKHKQVEPGRANRLTRRTLEDLADECLVSPGEYLVIPVVKVCCSRASGE